MVDRQLMKRDTEQVLTKEQSRALNDAVKFINRKSNEGARSLIEIGEYLLRNFFEGDPRKVEDRAPRKGISLRKLAEHEDICMSFMTLSNAVKLAVQESLFEDEKYKALTESHKIALFQIRDDDAKLSFADRVVDEKLSVRDLRELLIDAQYVATRGRPVVAGESSDDSADPYSAYFRPIDKLLKLDFSVDKIELNQLSDDRIEAMVKLKGQLDKIIQKWRRMKK